MKQLQKERRRSGLTPWGRIKRGLGSLILNLIMVIFSVSCIFPIVWLGYSTFKTNTEFNANVIALPSQLHFENYQKILFETNIFVYMKNSIIVTVTAVLLIVIAGFIVGFFLGRYQFRGSKFMLFYYLLGMLIPIHSLMIPVYVLFHSMHMLDKLISVILPCTAFGIPMAVFLVRGYVRAIPIEIEEAACIDGASFSSTLFRIILPLCRPILVTVIIIQFFACWNEFSFSLVLINSDLNRTLPLGLTLLKGQYGVNYPRMMTSMFIAIIPAMVLYFSFSKQIINGMVAGAVKG